MDNLTKASYVIFIISMLSLFVLTRFYEPGKRTIEDTKTMPDDSFVTISGKISGVKTYGKNYFLDIDEISSISAIGSIDPGTNYSGMKGKEVSIVGKITSYEGKKEIMIYRIK